MTKLFLLLFFTFSLVSNCEDKKNKESSHHSEAEMHDKKVPHDSLLVPEHQTPPIFKESKLPPKKNDTI